MATVTHDVATPECDKLLAAREPKPGAFAAFLAWIKEQGWEFCSFAETREAYYPVSDRLLAKFVPHPPDGGSDELGAFLDELDAAGICLCEHLDSNYNAVRRRVEAENGGGTPRHWVPQEEWDYQPAGWYPLVNRNIEAILARYFGVDLKAVDRERAAILAAYRDWHR